MLVWEWGKKGRVARKCWTCRRAGPGGQTRIDRTHTMCNGLKGTVHADDQYYIFKREELPGRELSTNIVQENFTNNWGRKGGEGMERKGGVQRCEHITQGGGLRLKGTVYERRAVL